MSISASVSPDLAIISIAASVPGRADQVMRGTLKKRTSGTILLSTDAEIASATPVTVRTRDLLFLGEVLASALEEESWEVRVQVKRALLVV